LCRISANLSFLNRDKRSLAHRAQSECIEAELLTEPGQARAGTTAGEMHADYIRMQWPDGGIPQTALPARNHDALRAYGARVTRSILAFTQAGWS